MKKIFTLVAGLLMTVLVFAADRRPTVTVNSQKNYKIVIDGRAYFGSNAGLSLRNLYDGRHTIQVFEMRGGMYGRRSFERMIASSVFRIDRRDVVINIDYFGNINIRELKNHGRFDRRDNDWNDHDGRDRDGDGRDRDYNGRDRDDNRRF